MTRTIPALLVVLAAAGLGSACAARATRTPVSCNAIGDHDIDVGTQLDCKWAYVKNNDTGNGNTVLWKAHDSSKNVKIVFDDKGVFPDLDCPGTQTNCQSGSLGKNLQGDPTKRYHASLCDKTNPSNCGPEIDPGIIIVP